MQFVSPGGETIAAIATAPGRGGVGIVRISGPGAARIGAEITRRTIPPRKAIFTSFLDQGGRAIDSGIALFFPGPASFTGDDVIELQGHGGPVVLDMLLERALAEGARLARPGEFSERAYLNGKIDLTQAEAIADLIDAASREAARGAMRSIEGAFSAEVTPLVDELTQLRMLVEACIDFPEEDIDSLADHDVLEQIDTLLARIATIENTARSGRLLRDGMNVLIAGKPNAGKSSLLNALAGDSVAIVSAIPGTTRDLIRERILIDGIPIHVTDTAGLRESPDEIEQEGIRRALHEAEQADVLLLVVDSSAKDDPDAILNDHFHGVFQNLPPVCVILNKCDLSGLTPGNQKSDRHHCVALSALSGAGMDALRTALRDIVGLTPSGGGGFSARRRHLDALARARGALEDARSTLVSKAGSELLAEDLRLAQQCVGEITGQLSPDELLGKIFSSFCIGK